jgi:hypothetical protein
MILPIAISLFLAGLFNGGMDGISFVVNYWLTKYKFFGPASFIFKYKYTTSTELLPYEPEVTDVREFNGIYYYIPYCKKAPWYYFGLYIPQYVERFPFSTTFAVMFTQGWHLLKAGQLTAFRVIIAYLMVGNTKASFNGWHIPEPTTDWHTWYIYPLTYLCIYIIERGAFTIAYTKK